MIIDMVQDLTKLCLARVYTLLSSSTFRFPSSCSLMTKQLKNHMLVWVCVFQTLLLLFIS